MSRKQVIAQINICRINRLEGRVFLENYDLCNVSNFGKYGVEGELPHLL
jgi:hypothetical protein